MNTLQWLSPSPCNVQDLLRSGKRFCITIFFILSFTVYDCWRCPHLAKFNVVAFGYIVFYFDMMHCSDKVMMVKFCALSEILIESIHSRQMIQIFLEGRWLHMKERNLTPSLSDAIDTIIYYSSLASYENDEQWEFITIARSAAGRHFPWHSSFAKDSY